MKKNFKGSIIMPIVTINGQAYDCQAKNNQFRGAKNQWIIQNAGAPFPASDISAFSGLHYYPVDCKYVSASKITHNNPMKKVDVQTTDGGTIQLYEYGTVTADIGGKKYDLKAYQNIDMPEFAHAPGTIFIPFKDETSGPAISSTFASGRYLVIKPVSGAKGVILDFNMATNPFENYNSNYSTLQVHNSNRIMAPLTTGERKYEDR